MSSLDDHFTDPKWYGCKRSQQGEGDSHQPVGVSLDNQI